MNPSLILRTTKAVRDIKSIEDIIAIESEPYDENVAARSIHDLLTGSCDEALRAQLTAGLSKLPQTYVLLPARKAGKRRW